MDKERQLKLFSEKIAIDKNLAFATIQKDGEVTYSFDFEESFDEESKDIWPLILFLSKMHYDNPLFPIEFTLEKFANFNGRKVRSYQVLTKGESNPNFSNDLERLMFKMLNRNLLLKTKYVSPSGEVREIIEPFPLIQKYRRVTYPDLDGRMKHYSVRLQDFVLDNFANYAYYISQEDHVLLQTKFYRNPNYTFLFARLANLINTLRSGRTETMSFNELTHILGYTSKETRDVKRKITKTIEALLELETLRGLGFRWNPTKNGYLYVPHFYLTDQIHRNTLNESAKDKWKRVDVHFLTKLNPFKDVKENPMIQVNSLKELTDKLGNKMYPIFIQAYKTVMLKEPTGDQINHFFTHYTYTDDYNNEYVSFLLNFVKINEKPLLQDTYYQNRKLIHLY